MESVDSALFVRRCYFCLLFNKKLQSITLGFTVQYDLSLIHVDVVKSKVQHFDSDENHKIRSTYLTYYSLVYLLVTLG